MNETCGADAGDGPCVLPARHNMGQIDVPENHRARPAVAPPGTCKQIGCPQWGLHPPHGIGAGTWEDYSKTDTCLGFPEISAHDFHLVASCSLGGQWAAPDLEEFVTPQDMAALVDKHKRECPNRQVRP